MSASLLRKGLELLEASAASPSPKGAKAAVLQSKRSQKRRRKEMLSRHKREKATVKGRVTKSALEEYRKHQAVDHFRENLKYMMNSQYTADHTITQKILDQNRGRKSQDRPEEKAKKKSKGTVFTEEDFQRFEKEYFGGAGTV